MRSVTITSPPASYVIFPYIVFMLQETCVNEVQMVKKVSNKMESSAPMEREKRVLPEIKYGTVWEGHRWALSRYVSSPYRSMVGV